MTNWQWAVVSSNNVKLGCVFSDVSLVMSKQITYNFFSEYIIGANN